VFTTLAHVFNWLRRKALNAEHQVFSLLGISPKDKKISSNINESSHVEECVSDENGLENEDYTDLQNPVSSNDQLLCDAESMEKLP
jgi:hypothetical protein